MPVIIPALGDELNADELLEALDGLLFTGSPSNVEPHHYGGEPSAPGTLHDPQRDATTLPLIPRAVAAGVPVLGVCRGFQEMNVAFGGTLWQQLHEVPGYVDHREDTEPAAGGAVARRARSDAGAGWPAAAHRRRAERLRSTRCTPRACASSGPGLRSRRARRTA